MKHREDRESNCTDARKASESSQSQAFKTRRGTDGETDFAIVIRKGGRNEKRSFVVQIGQEEPLGLRYSLFKLRAQSGEQGGHDMKAGFYSGNNVLV